MLRAYQRLLQTQPLLTQMVSAGIISATGDVFAQFAIEKRSLKDYDGIRTVRFFVLSGGIIAPCMNRWLLLLERVKSGPAKLVPLKRLFYDQGLYAPVVIAANLVWLRMLEGYSLRDSVALCKRDWWKIWTTSLAVWPPAQLFNFYLMPLQYRVLFIHVVMLFWNTFLSFATQKKLVQPSRG